MLRLGYSSMVPGRHVLGVLLCLGALLPAVACAQSRRCAVEPASGVTPAPDPELARLARERPDSVIGVLLRTHREPGERDRAALTECGLQIGSVIGDIVTGRVRADAAEQLARHPLVRYMEVAREVRVPPPIPRSDTLRPELHEPPE